MPLNPQPVFCSEACERAERVRSFGECPECKQSWSGQASGEITHYRNNAWTICNYCSSTQNRCARCGTDIAAYESDIKEYEKNDWFNVVKKWTVFSFLTFIAAMFGSFLAAGVFHYFLNFSRTSALSFVPPIAISVAAFAFAHRGKLVRFMGFDDLKFYK